MAAQQSRSPASTRSSRERLLTAAKRLFAEQGYEQTATSAIAREAGTSESQLMRYFGGKVGLLEAVFEEAWIDLNRKVARVVEASDGDGTTLLNVLGTITSALSRDPDLATLFLFETRRRRGDAPRVRQSAGFIAFSGVVKTLIRHAQAEGAIQRSLDVNALTAAVLGATEALIRERVLNRAAGQRAFPEQEIRRTLNLVLRGFAREPARARAVGRRPSTRKRM